MTLKDSIRFEIRRAREELRLNQTEFARLVGLRQDRISRFETGDRLPSIQALRAIARAIGCFDIRRALDLN
jgi:transcriptional regulator with XRE-family HTH domain